MKDFERLLVEEYQNMPIDYEHIEPEREYSKYPKGLRHYSKERMIENSLFDIDILIYKIKSIVKGQNNEILREHGRENESDASKILYRFVQRILHPNRQTAADGRNDRAVEDRYIRLDEREREADQRSDKERQEST